ncbi:hypothetical protein EVAR_69723_1 [Eumeta japonica]|uniref:Uncharacterized protein n=1 Tax=Eumeta variegata TaxID=151549 RepID=A0A4C2A9F4_EUMVA|nr:hypothetical protein EVAR_69723_1 [Eumeta japonica]
MRQEEPCSELLCEIKPKPISAGKGTFLSCDYELKVAELDSLLLVGLMPFARRSLAQRRTLEQCVACARKSPYKQTYLELSGCVQFRALNVSKTSANQTRFSSTNSISISYFTKTRAGGVNPSSVADCMRAAVVRMRPQVDSSDVRSLWLEINTSWGIAAGCVAISLLCTEEARELITRTGRSTCVDAPHCALRVTPPQCNISLSTSPCSSRLVVI